VATPQRRRLPPAGPEEPPAGLLSKPRGGTREELRRCQGLQLEELPLDALQAATDLIPTLESRACLQMTCSRLLCLNRSLAPPGLEAFVVALQGGIVDFRNVQIGDHGARVLAQALMESRSHGFLMPLRLHLGSNGITDDGAEALGAALTTSPANIKRLYLDNNKIGDRGAQAILCAACGHATIVEVDLHNNLLTRSGKLAAVASQKDATNKALQHIFVNFDLPTSTYIADVQTDITSNMRCILVDWMADVCRNLNKRKRGNDVARAYFLGCCFLDRYLCHCDVERQRFQLVGTACIFLAVQQCEKLARDIEESTEFLTWLAYMTDHSVTRVEVMECAQEIHTALNAEIVQPTTRDFLLRYLTCTGWTEESWDLADYILHLAALSYSLLQHSPQAVAAAAVLLAHDALPRDPRALHKLLRCAGVSVKRDLVPCVKKLADIHASVYTKTSTLQGHRGRCNLSAEKLYSTREFARVASIPPTRPALIGVPFSRSSAMGLVGLPYARTLLMHTADWSLYGSKRRTATYV
jgi:hypothetical protein